jgi:hypothetical protein
MQTVTLTDITPRGVAQFPRLNAPEMPPYEGYDGPPQYTCSLRIGGEESAELRSKIDGVFDDNISQLREEHGERKVKEADTRGYEAEYARDANGDETNEPTGFFIFKFKLPSEVKRRRDGKIMEFSPFIIDAKRNPTDALIGGGSELRIKFEARGWFMQGTKNAGVKLSLKAVQILKLVAPNGGGADSSGFEDEVGFDGAEESGGFQDETAARGAEGSDY